MEKIVRRLASKIARSQGLDAEREAVVAYGLLAMTQISVITLLALALGFAVGAPVEALIVCFSVSFFRKYSGGAHAYDADFCTVVSVAYCTLAAAASGWLSPLYRLPAMLDAVISFYATAYWVIYRYVPVDSPNKPIKNPLKIKRMRKGSFLLVTAYLALQLLFIFQGTRNPLFQGYGISLLLGVAWQTLTLTPIGAVLLNKLNDLPKFLRKEAHT